MSANNTCLNCRYWRDKAWTNKGWGSCDNEYNEVKIAASPLLAGKMDDELIQMVLSSIRYPEDFGCIFFEPLLITL